MVWASAVTQPFAKFENGIPAHPDLGYLDLSSMHNNRAPSEGRGKVRRTKGGTEHVFPRKKGR